MNDPEIPNTASNRPQNTDDIPMSDATLETALLEQSSTALVLYSKPPSILEMAQGVVESGQLSEVENILQKLKTPVEKQEFFVHSASLFRDLRDANGQLSVCLWEAAQRVQQELKDAGAWETTVEVLKDVSKEATKYIQADHRKERSRKSIAQFWSANWRDTFNQLVDLKFPADGFEAELFLQDLATVAGLAKPETVAPLLTEVYSERLNKPGALKINTVTRADLAKVKDKLWQQLEESPSDDPEEDIDVVSSEPSKTTSSQKAQRRMIRLDYLPADAIRIELGKIEDPVTREVMVDTWNRMAGTDGDASKRGLKRLRCLLDAWNKVSKRMQAKRKRDLRKRASARAKDNAGATS